jgi:FtsP/CotA-like multicopper oxidase with cupredoxin domain
LFAFATLLALAGCSIGDSNVDAPTKAPSTKVSYTARTRTYYIALDEEDWDYAPDGENVVSGKPFDDAANVFVAGNGKDRIGSKYKKALYHEYTDDTFKTRKERKPQDGYLGMLGPVIRGVVGDTIKVVFKNNGTHHYTIHPHGVFYKKNAEGSETNDGTSGDDKGDDGVHPGEQWTYTWEVPERSGPGEGDPSSRVWLYHSHEVGEEYAGAVGVIIIADKEHGTASGMPSDVDQEVVSFFSVMDENQSILIDDNIDEYAPKAVPDDEEFYESNLMHSINGFVFGNGPHVSVVEGSKVRWHLVSLGTEVDLHTPHWHGNVVNEYGQHTDVIELLPASMKSVDMIPDDPGTWMFHCHVNDHILAGMITLYEVTGAPEDDKGGGDGDSDDTK